MHDWTRVEAGIYHAFHFNWIGQIAEEMNAKLPHRFYALPEQRTGPFEADVLTLQAGESGTTWNDDGDGGTATLIRTAPRTTFQGESDAGHYRRKQRHIAIRHVSRDRLVAVIEIVSPGNKSEAEAVTDFADKAVAYLEAGVHVSFVDPFPSGSHDPDGLHAEVWSRLTDDQVTLAGPLAAVAYEAGRVRRFFAEPFKVGDSLPPLPVFLEAGVHIAVDLDATYTAAFTAVPKRWRQVIDAVV